MNPRPILATAIAAAAPVIRAADGTFLHHRDWGRGRPVVFVHAWALTSDFWDNQANALCDAGLRCITYDRRGHGRSDQSDGGYDFDTLADDLAAVIEGLDLTEVTLVGHSMGAGEIVRYLSRQGSGRIARVAMVAPALPCATQKPDNPDGLPVAVFEAVRDQWRTDRGQWMADNTGPFVRPQTSQPVRDWITAQMMATPLRVWLACNRALVEADFRAELTRLERPTLILHGDADMSAPLPMTGAKVASLVPGAQLKVYAGGPHALPVTDVGRLNSDLMAFIGV